MKKWCFLLLLATTTINFTAAKYPVMRRTASQESTVSESESLKDFFCNPQNTAESFSRIPSQQTLSPEEPKHQEKYCTTTYPVTITSTNTPTHQQELLYDAGEALNLLTRKHFPEELLRAITLEVSSNMLLKQLNTIAEQPTLESLHYLIFACSYILPTMKNTTGLQEKEKMIRQTIKSIQK